MFNNGNDLTNGNAALRTALGEYLETDQKVGVLHETEHDSTHLNCDMYDTQVLGLGL